MKMKQTRKEERVVYVESVEEGESKYVLEDMLVTLDTSHSETSELNARALSNTAESHKKRAKKEVRVRQKTYIVWKFGEHKKANKKRGKGCVSGER
jgi:hypothetical protein